MSTLFKYCWLIFGALIQLWTSDAYKILVIFPIPGKSHGILGDAVVRYLLEAGHEVTYITSFPTKTLPANLHQVDVSANGKVFNGDTIDIKAIMDNKLDLRDAKVVIDMATEIGEFTIMNENVQKFLKDPSQQFDLVLAEWLFIEIYSTYFFYRQENAYRAYIVPILRAKGKPVPSFNDLKYNASLVLGNSHVSLGQATRLPQNYKAIGGYHVESLTKPLPYNLQKIMDNSKNGVIYFSMGSNLKSKDLPDEIKRNLIKVFGQLKQTILWKFEENISNLPDNVHILDWAPQQSILSHPNCILFITHGGLLSIIEAIHYGVPFIGIPVFADQLKNVETAALKGFGTKVELSYTMADDIKAAIIKMTSNSSYREKIKEFSFIYHDRPVPPGAELVHWVEHVVSTRGALHLRSPALQVPWYQKVYLDLFAVILTIALVSNALFKRLYCSVVIERRNIKLD